MTTKPPHTLLLLSIPMRVTLPSYIMATVVSNSFDTVLHGTDCAMYDTLNNIINDDCDCGGSNQYLHNVWDVS